MQVNTEKSFNTYLYKSHFAALEKPLLSIRGQHEINKKYPIIECVYIYSTHITTLCNIYMCK